MFNKEKSLAAANDIKSKLCKSSKLGLSDSDVELKQDKDGSVEITILKGKLPAGSVDGATPKNISAVIDDDYYEYRRQGNTFSQPVSGTFTIGIKSLNESFSFRDFLNEHY